jgi:sugar O-acyltransferase (sialic acid O-acetyltransferase NeuD family)
MLVIGCGGFAKELMEVIIHNEGDTNLHFYDDLNDYEEALLFEKYPRISSPKEAEHYFLNTDKRFVLGLGNPSLRKSMATKFAELGGKLVSVISSKASIGSYNVEIEDGCTILDHAVISNGCKLGKGCLVYYHAIVTHDCILEDFVELAPGATLLGGVKVAKETFVGANATILPRLKIGKYSIIGAGAVVTKDIGHQLTVKGNPAK